MREPSKLTIYQGIRASRVTMTGATRTLCFFVTSDADLTRSAIMFASAILLWVSAAAQLLSSCQYLLDLLPQARVKSMPEVLQFDNLDLYCSVIFSLLRHKIPQNYMTDHSYVLWGYSRCMQCEVLQACLFFFFIQSNAVPLSVCALAQTDRGIGCSRKANVWNSNVLMPDLDE
jgi:hypothetical protein